MLYSVCMLSGSFICRLDWIQITVSVFTKISYCMYVYSTYTHPKREHTHTVCMYVRTYVQFNLFNKYFGRQTKSVLLIRVSYSTHQYWLREWS